MGFRCCIPHMMTSSNGNIFRITGPLCGDFTGPRWIPHTKASDAELWCFFFYLCLNKPVCKQSWGWWFEMPARSLWRHYNDLNSVYFPPTIRHTRVGNLGVAALHPGIDFSSQSHVTIPCPFVNWLYVVPIIFMWVLSNPLQIPIIYHHANHVGTFFVIFLFLILDMVWNVSL